MHDSPRLQLVTPVPVPLPELEGKKLASVRFTRDIIELDFTGSRISTAGAMTIVTASSRLSIGDPGSRDALCSLIGLRVDRVRAVAGERFELQFDNGFSVLLPRTSRVPVAETSRRINES